MSWLILEFNEWNQKYEIAHMLYNGVTAKDKYEKLCSDFPKSSYVFLECKLLESRVL